MDNSFLTTDVNKIDQTKLPRALSETVRDLREKQNTQSMYQYHTDEPSHDHSRDTGNQ